MNLSMEMLVEVLQINGYPIRHFEVYDESGYEYSLPLLYSTNQKMEDGSLYVVEADSLPANPFLGLQVGVISVGEPPEAYRNGRCSLAVLPEKTTFLKLYADIIEVFRRFDIWLCKLDTLIRKKASLQSYLEATCPLVHNTLSIHDPQFTTLAILPEKTPSGEDYDSVLSKISPEWIVENQRADLSRHEPYLASYTFNGEPHQTLMCNVFDEEALLAIVNISDSDSPIRKIDSWILTRLCEKLKKALVTNQQQLHKQMKSFRRTFSDLLDGVYVSPQELNRRTKRAGFSDDHQWFIVYLQFDPEYSSYIPLEAIVRQVQRQIPAMTSLQFNMDFALLIDLSLSGGQQEEILKRLSNVLTGSKYLMGSSDCFTDLTDTKLYYQEAQLALTYGLHQYPREKVFRFSSVAPYYLLHFGTSVLPAKLLCSRGVVQLNELDKKSGNSFCKTLQVCFKNHMSITKSASELNIHRSTLLYRLDRIRSFLDIDTDNYLEQLYICQSLALCLEEPFQLTLP